MVNGISWWLATLNLGLSVNTPIQGATALWLALAIPSAAFAAYDLARNQPIATVMRWGWVLVILYTGPVGLVIYLLACREPLAGTHEAYVAPRWKQAVGSTIHCVAGDATGVILGAVVGFFLHLSRIGDVAFEYAAGFAFGLLIFQALFSRIMMGGSYWSGVRRTILPEWLSMNALMGGMIPVMVLLMDDGSGPTGLRFWGVMSLAIFVGALVAYPVNLWLVARGLKHGMGTVRVLGQGGQPPAAAGVASHAGHGMSTRPRPGRRETALVLLASLSALAVGLAIAWGIG